MASYYYYQQNGPHGHGYSPSSGYPQTSPPLPLHLCVFLLTLFLFMGFSWYMSNGSAFKSLLFQIKLILMASSLLLLLVVHWLSGADERRRVYSSFLIPQAPERESIHRAGGSPLGVGLVLVLLMFMISYQSYFQHRWFPLLSRYHRI